MELIVIRHGQSEADLLGVHEGKADFPITELGRKQATSMARYVAQLIPPDFIVTSPLKRAAATARILQEEVGCDLAVENDLKEFNNGVLAGLKREDAAIRYPLPKNGRPFHIPIPEGESALELRFRAERVLHKIMHDYCDVARIAIISHGGLISNLLQAFLKMPNQEEFVFPTGDTGIHFLEIKGTQRKIRFLNKQEHLL